MVVFNKPNSAITDRLYHISSETRYECEICFMIIDESIAGVAVGLDLTKADIQNSMKKQGLPWERAKSFDKSAVLGDFVKFDSDTTGLKMELYLNDKLRQYATYDMMIYKPQQILDECKSFMSLNNGDIIMSGTPSGVGGYDIGDVFVAKLYHDDNMIVQARWEVQAAI